MEKICRGLKSSLSSIIYKLSFCSIVRSSISTPFVIKPKISFLGEGSASGDGSASDSGSVPGEKSVPADGSASDSGSVPGTVPISGGGLTLVLSAETVISAREGGSGSLVHAKKVNPIRIPERRIRIYIFWGFE